MRAPLLLTGGPAVGKSATAARLTSARRLAALVDVDDVRHLVVAGHAAPWEGSAGRDQQRIGVENAVDLARRFLDHGIDVVLADVANEWTLPLYRRRLPGLVVVRLQTTLSEARRRAGTRPVHLTAEEFVELHARERAADLDVDHTIDVSALTLEEQTAAVRELWPDLDPR